MRDRIDQVNELLKRELAQAIIQTVEVPAGVLITVARVKTSRDLHYATVWVSVLPYDEADALCKILQRKTRKLQIELASRLSLKFTPKIEFRLDDTEEQADKIESLIDYVASQYLE